MALEPEAGVADEDGDDRRGEHSERRAVPGQRAEGDDREAGSVGPDSEEYGVAEGDLSAVAADDVPGLRHGGVEQDHRRHVSEEGGTADKPGDAGQY